MKTKLSKAGGGSCDQLDLCQICRISQNVNITLHELTVTTLLWAVSSPHISHLQCLKRRRQIIGIVGVIPCQGHRKIITHSLVYQICLAGSFF